MNTSRLETAKQAHAEHFSAYARIEAERQRIEQGARPAIAQAGSAQQARQTLRQKIAAMLKLGGAIDTGDAELKALTKQIVAGESAEIIAAAAQAAKDAELAELNEQARELHQQTKQIEQELAGAQLELAASEINSTLIPQLRDAAARFERALGSLIGAGQAHCELAQRAREQFGVSVSSLGTDRPVTVHDLALVGFGIADNHGFCTLRLDATQATEQAKQAALARWTA
jgi:hypothetical protein